MEKTKVKLVYRKSTVDENSLWRNQCTKNGNEFGNCIFTFNPLEKDYDWLVVMDEVPNILPKRKEQLSCNKNHTILLTSEPSHISRYGRAFSGQFKYVITNQDKKYLPHKKAIRSQTGNVWYYGKKLEDILNDSPKKKKLISTVCSSKQQGHTMHKKRFNFTKIMEEKISELDRFGHGIKWIDHKYDAIDDYKFHVAIENEIGKNVWTEKLADTFLGFSVPIYCGCSNVFDYFPEDSLILIDINDIEGSIKKIKEIISKEGEYERRLPAVMEARRRVIEEYNLLAMVDKIISEDKEEYIAKNNGVIYNRRIMRFKYLPDLFFYIGFRISNFIKGLISKLK